MSGVLEATSGDSSILNESWCAEASTSRCAGGAYSPTRSRQFVSSGTLFGSPTVVRRFASPTRPPPLPNSGLTGTSRAVSSVSNLPVKGSATPAAFAGFDLLDAGQRPTMSAVPAAQGRRLSITSRSPTFARRSSIVGGGDGSRRNLVDGYCKGEIAWQQLAALSDRVVLKQAIGTGNTGEVFVAVDKKAATPEDSEVAVKLVSLDRLKTVGCKEEYLKREIQTMASVSHPNVVKLIDVFQSVVPVDSIMQKSRPPYICMVMECVSGEALTASIRRMRQAGSHGGDLVRRVVPQIAAGVGELHNKRIVHRDIWAENVLLDVNGQVKIIDFGCAVSVDAPKVENRMNIPYMSPQAFSNHRQHIGDDAWALGCLICEVVTAKFLNDHMGRCDIPVHSMPDVLLQMQKETRLYGGDDIAEVAYGLLEHVLERRFTMTDVARSLPDTPGTGEVTPSLCRSVASISSGVSTAASLYGSGPTCGPGAPTGAAHKMMPEQRDVLSASLPRTSNLALGYQGSVGPLRFPMGAMPPIKTPVPVRSVRRDSHSSEQEDAVTSPRASSTTRTLQSAMPFSLNTSPTFIEALRSGDTVAYKARTTGHRFFATVMDKTHRGVKVLLHGSNTEKFVEENELWRLSESPEDDRLRTVSE
eukprot:TRINITY_DN9747_c0_g1_i1.p1 TRINITY_DN9747_c0_g1~~TRINITY_DN9747_c0_g1_i1.p1  ORF type:complete len:644 (-),score=115.14 TRINITY_DN9747_c0_g1_i1:361-2292(-)